jgi:hypothetical protein
MKIPSAAAPLLVGLLMGAAATHAEEPTSEMDALVDSLVQQAAMHMHLPSPDTTSRPATPAVTNRFVSSTSGGSLAASLGLRSDRSPAKAEANGFRKLLSLRNRRGEAVRLKRRAAYQQALQELMVEHQRASQVPQEDVVELSRLTGHRPYRIRRDLTRVTLPLTE